MRYLKVLGLVVIFFLVMLFFLDNREAFTASYPLTLNLRFMPAFTTATPVPCYYMLLACFLLGGLVTLGMLVWDRISLTARLSLSKMRANGFEKDLKRAEKLNAELNEKIKALSSELDTLKGVKKIA